MEEGNRDWVAKLILSAFEQYRSDYGVITRGAQQRFESAAWNEVQQASIDRIRLYKIVIQELRERIDEFLIGEILCLEDWKGLKTAYQKLILGRADIELAQTVFNTFFRKSVLFLNDREMTLSNDIVFLTEPLITELSIREGDDGNREAVNLTRCYGLSDDLASSLKLILSDCGFRLPFRDLDSDALLIKEAMENFIHLMNPASQVRFEMLKPIFYRNKGAYLIGKMDIDGHFFPLAIPIHNNGDALYVDTIIWNENDLSVIFSFTRSYFMVDVELPSALINYLSKLLPNKKSWELYTAVGSFKHGKTEFYRSFIHHLSNSSDSFVLAEGIKGLVMTVFTLPSYQIVFKIIKDKFSPTKKVTRKQVREAYQLVKSHDRVGRMADTQEFTDFVFPKNRFSKDLIDELLSVASSSVTVTENQIIISHLYTERLMTPMNLYMKGKNDLELKILLDEYGNAIKQLAAANIFPGDMLLKNFGVTRHGRVIFYDYDEICYLTEINFRKIPPPRYPEDAMSAQPWYNVAPQDVFPEEFINFLFYDPKLKEMFNELHGELFTVEFWQSLQENIRQNRIMDVFPYRQNRRFKSNCSHNQ
ncbi:MAG: bifunctional isocitrate dehydrogenase kinase/phosphatase [Pseudomonadales bacterium]|nr:bifunctional isocitrate dehydrogenase kinase/phosphatase [Pseudomonadales bacterium]